MVAPKVEALSAAARTGITVINLDGSTRRIRGATASVGTPVVDVFFDPELTEIKAKKDDGLLGRTARVRLDCALTTVASLRGSCRPIPMPCHT